VIYTYHAGWLTSPPRMVFFYHIIIDMSFITPKLVRRLLYFLLSLRLLFLFWSNLPLYTKQYDINKSINHYHQSQYTQGDKAKLILSDSELYIVEGHFLVNGEDPERMFPGHPTLGKYMIGLSLKYFHNPFIISYFSFCFVILLFILISKSPLLALILTFEPLMLEQTQAALLDIQLAIFHLLVIFSYLRFLSKKYSFKWSFFTFLFLGFSLNIKFFPVSIPLFTALIVDTVLSGNFTQFIRLIKSLPAIILGFLVGNFPYFFHHPSLISFAKFFRYKINWWAGGPHATPGGMWKVIFLNQWDTWWGQGTIAVENWWIIWPIIFFTAFFSTRRKVIYLYFIFSLILFSLGIFFPRYLVPLIPFVYLLSYDTIKWLWLKLSKKVFLKK